MSGNMRKIVIENLEVLLSCTIVTHEMVNRLVQEELITFSEREKLMNPCISNVDQATTLYIQIATRWEDKDFEKFKRILMASGNARVLEILNEKEEEKRQTTRFPSPPLQHETLSIIKPSVAETEEQMTVDPLLKILYAREQQMRKATHQMRSIREPSAAETRHQMIAEYRLLKEEMKAQVHGLHEEVALLRKESALKEIKLLGEVTVLKEKFTDLQKSSVEEINRLKRKLEWPTSVHLSHQDGTSKTNWDNRNSNIQLESTEASSELALIPEEGKWPQEVVRTKLSKIESHVNSLELVSKETTHQLQIIRTKQNELDEQVLQIKSDTGESLKNLQSAVLKLENSLAKSNEQWVSGSNMTFSVHKVMGMWYPIERFDRNSHGNSYAKLEEFSFSLSGDTVEHTHRYQWKISSKRQVDKYYYTVDTESPQCWTDTSGSSGRIWVTTDYSSYGIITRSNGREISSGGYLYILSRKRTIPPQTLQILRHFAVTRGFTKTNAVLVDQIP